MNPGISLKEVISWMFFLFLFGGSFQLSFTWCVPFAARRCIRSWPKPWTGKSPGPRRSILGVKHSPYIHIYIYIYNIYCLVVSRESKKQKHIFGGPQISHDRFFLQQFSFCPGSNPSHAQSRKAAKPQSRKAIAGWDGSRRM